MLMVIFIIFSIPLLLVVFANNPFIFRKAEIEPKLLDVVTARTITLGELLKDIGNKSIVMIFLNARDLGEECQKLSLTVRHLYIQYGRVIEFLTIIQINNIYGNKLAEDFSAVIPECWINNSPLLWRHLVDLENRISMIYNVTKTPVIITLDSKHQFVEKIEGFVSEQRLEVALVQIICDCASPRKLLSNLE